MARRKKKGRPHLVLVQDEGHYVVRTAHNQKLLEHIGEAKSQSDVQRILAILAHDIKPKWTLAAPLEYEWMGQGWGRLSQDGLFRCKQTGTLVRLDLKAA